MKIDGLDWMDWLHRVRHDAEAKRIRDGLSVEQWLHQVRVRAHGGDVVETAEGDVLLLEGGEKVGWLYLPGDEITVSVPIKIQKARKMRATATWARPRPWPEAVIVDVDVDVEEDLAPQTLHARFTASTVSHGSAGDTMARLGSTRSQAKSSIE